MKKPETIETIKEELRLSSSEAAGKILWNAINSTKLDFEDFQDLLNEITVQSNQGEVDLRKCKRGDILISKHGAKLMYIAPTPYENYRYLDHVVQYLEVPGGQKVMEGSFGTRTNDGLTYRNVRLPSDHDIVAIIPKSEIEKTLLLPQLSP